MAKTADYSALTTEEKLCLQRWFRQAIVKMEQRRALSQLYKEDANQATAGIHRKSMIRRPMRSNPVSRVKELVY